MAKVRYSRARTVLGHVMANDAKLGLVLGVALVLVIALIFFRSDTVEAKVAADQVQATAPLKKDEPAKPPSPSDMSFASPEQKSPY